MDEPLSNLDAALRISMRAEIKQLHQAMQTTFVYVTHDQAEALTLADRIVVMRGGVVQQIGVPDEIYERPRNMFVASFLGNPPINFLEGLLVLRNDRLGFERGSLRIEFLPEMAFKLKGQAGREVVLGLRAEDVVESLAPEAGASLTGRVASVLPVGSDQFLDMDMEGARLFLRLGKECHYRVGETATLAINLNRIHLFDKASTQSILWS